MIKLLKTQIFWFTKKIKGDHVDSFSAHVSFFIIIAFIPFMMFLLSLLQTININGSSLLTSLLGILPETARTFFLSIFNEERQSFAVISISAITSLWSSSMAMLALVKGMNSVFDVNESRNYIWLRLASVLYTLAFAIILAFTTVLLVFGNTIYTSFMKNVNPVLSKLLVDFKSLAVFIILFVFFAFSYMVLPRKAKVKLINCVTGAAFSAAGWVLFSFFFSIFVENFSNYSSVYGSLAAIVILMLWLYFCMYIMFVGGEIAMWLQTGLFAKSLEEYRNAKAKAKMNKIPVKPMKQNEKDNRIN